MIKVGFVGWRGMVGSVLMDRMRQENDFKGFEPLFFSTSQMGADAPEVGLGASKVEDAGDIDKLKAMDIIVTCQGGSYTTEIYPRLMAAGWKGYWIDAASTLRMEDDAIIILDPVNRGVIEAGLAKGIKNFIGGNCTVSLMLMAIGGLFGAGLVEWVTSMTYQAASGAGANNMRELIAQMRMIGAEAASVLDDPAASALELERNVMNTLGAPAFPTQFFTQPLAASLLPWIDKEMASGQSKEEWKGLAETNKILGNKQPIPIDGLCVRVGLMRCHAQALTIKLKKDAPLDELTAIIAGANDWVKVVENRKEVTLAELTPARISGTLSVPIGRLHKMNLGPQYLAAFTCGDQLLWGAAEPLRRMLGILLEHLG